MAPPTPQKIQVQSCAVPIGFPQARHLKNQAQDMVDEVPKETIFFGGVPNSLEEKKYTEVL